MSREYELDQLKRDAEKQGSWLAKIVYAKYLIDHKTDLELAKNYLKQIIKNDHNDYVIFANYLYELTFKPENLLVRTVLKKEIEKLYTDEFYPFESQYKLSAPEPRYKMLRYQYDLGLTDNYQYISELDSLLFHEEITDTLTAKIYFQLIRFNIEQAQKTGQGFYLNEAQKYCSRLMEDKNLSEMFKAKEAQRISSTLKPTLDQFTGFKAYLKKCFAVGNEVSRMTFKYLGIVLGNLVDFSIVLPKTFGKTNVSEKSITTVLFKDTGFAAVGKWLGKKIGKHVIGNLVTGPIGAFIGFITYPFVAIYNNFKSDSNVKSVAQDVVNLHKANDGKDDSAQQEKMSTHAAVRSIFNHKKAEHHYQAPTSPVYVIQKIVPTFVPYRPHAYGRVFGNSPKIEPISNRQTSSPSLITEQSILYPALER